MQSKTLPRTTPFGVSKIFSLSTSRPMLFNVLQIVSRELQMGNDLTKAEWHRLNALMGEDAPGQDLHTEIDVMTRALCVKIRAGDADSGAFHDAVAAHVRQTVMEKLQVSNPKFLERVKETANLHESTR